MTCQDRPSQDRNRALCDAGGRPQLSGFDSSVSDSSVPERRLLDASLLFDCMARLQIDRGELANEDPLLFYELQGKCVLCRSKDECAEDLAGEFGDARWDRWWAYCPNSATLAQIGAVQNCGRAARRLKKPRSAV